MKFSKSLLLSLALVMPTANAIEDDFSQQVAVTADRSSADLQSRTLTYIDNVLVTQGTLQITADKLTLQSDEGRTQQVFVATGTPATYQQVMENGMLAEAQAKEIRYTVATRTLVLIGDAQMSQEGSVVKGERISYNAEQQKLSAEGREDEQITTIFMPAPKEQNSNNDEQNP